MSFIYQSFIKTRKLQIQQLQVPNWQTLCETKCVEEGVGEKEEEGKPRNWQCSMPRCNTCGKLRCNVIIIIFFFIYSKGNTSSFHSKSTDT